MDRSIALLEALTQADGAPGFEGAVRKIFVDELSDSGEILTDRIGGVVCKKPGTAEGPRIMLDCHLDEVGFIVQHITSQGYLKFLPLGGWWTHVLPAQRVRVHGSKGPMLGVIGSIPVHFLPPDRRNQLLDFKDLFIDVGCSSREDAEAQGLRPGSWVVPVSPFTHLADEKLLLSKAFDNRAGCAAVIETMQAVGDHPNTIFATGSVQEEAGLRGAQATASVVNPDAAVVLEGSPADDTHGMSPEESQCAIGGGVQIRAFDQSMIANPKFVDLAVETAKARDIPYQIAVRSSGGTDGGRIHLHERGVPTVVLAVPARYIHAHTSIIHVDDYLATRRLATAIVERLDEKTVSALA